MYSVVCVLCDMCVLCVTDPLLIHDHVLSGESGFENMLQLFPNSFSSKQVQPEFSGIHYY